MTKKKTTSPVRASTQDFVEIETVRDDIVLLKDNSCCVVIEVGTTNFGLLPQEEQNALIYSFGSLLNSLSFPVQIVVLSRQINISSYLEFLQEKTKTQTNPIVASRLASYSDFIKNIVKKNTTLEKSFYFVVPFSPLEMGPQAVTHKNLNKEYVLDRAKIALYPKRDHLLRLLQKAGLGGKPLYDQSVVQLFYNLFNPSHTDKKLAPIKNYTEVIQTS